MKKDIDVLVIGGGPAGLAAAVGAKENGAGNVLILERENSLGGILKQCIHNGFGLHTFKEELTGPEYAQRYIDKAAALDIPYKADTMVLSVGGDKKVTAINPEDGLFELKPKSVILTCGCRERPRGAINIAGSRAAGIYSAGTAQKYVNMMGYMVGRRVVILGSGDIGLIMARRMVFEGAKVLAVIELMPYSSGLKRNIVQCLHDFDIPLYYSHTVTDIRGKERVEGVTAMRVDEKLRPVPGTEMEFDCDTLLLSVGLLPENELSKTAGIELSPVTGGPVVDENMMTNVDGIFAAGNMLHVHDLVDFVSEESALAGANAARYTEGKALLSRGGAIKIETGNAVRYTVPQILSPDGTADKLPVKFRVDKVYKDCRVNVTAGDTPLMSLKKRVLAPGEMEIVTLNKNMLDTVRLNKSLKIEVVPG